MHPLDHALANGPFETQTRLTQIAMAVPVAGMIADEVCPRVRTAYKFTFAKHDTEDILTIPDVRASRASELNEVEFGTRDETTKTEDYGLIDPVPQRDIDEAMKQEVPFDPLANATARIAVLVKLAREKRVADLATGAANYAADFHATLAGGSQWSRADSNPLKAVLEALDKPLVRPNTLVLGQAVWTAFRQHPKIVEAIKLSGAGAEASGVVMREAVAQLLEIERVLVGQAWYQSANRGQDANYRRLWGKHAALLHINRNITGPQEATPTFCFTGEAMPMQTGTYEAPGRGVGQGSTVVKVSESCKEVVSWSDAGFLWRNAVQ